MRYRLSCVWLPLFLGFLVVIAGCESAETGAIGSTEAADSVLPEPPQEAPLADSLTAGFRPATALKGSFEGTVWINTPSGDVVGVNVTARVGRPSNAYDGWDLYFFDPTQTLSADGQLALKSGAAHWLTRDDEHAFLQAELVSLGRDVLQSPGWSVLQHPVSGDVRGEAWMRVPSSGADLQPLHLTFFLRPRTIVSCDSDCDAGSVCDPLSGFCASRPFAPGEFRGDLELSASHQQLQTWSFGRQVASSLSAANVWCANETLGFGGEWTTLSMGTMARAVMPHSGDLYCLEPANPFTGARSRGPIPLANRADLIEAGLLRPIDDDRLAHLCAAELQRPAPLGFAGRFGDTSASFDAFRDGHLNYEADCISMGHFAALVHLAQAGIFGNDDAKNQLSKRALSRLLQQWVQVHAFVATEHSGLSATQRLEKMETGWAAVLQLLGSSALEYLIDPAQPDYREGLRFGLCRNGCGDPALRCESEQEACNGGVCRQKQCVLRQNMPTEVDPSRGLAASLMDGLAVHMNLVQALIKEAPVAASAAQNYGRSIRYALLVETLATKLVHLGTRCESPGVAGCPVPAWQPAFEASRERYDSARRAATGALIKRLADTKRNVPSLPGREFTKPL